MEESGFKVYKDFRTSRHLIDIYGILPTVLGEIGVVVACKNYDEKWKVGLDVLKEMEMVAKTLKASKVVIVTTSGYSSQSINYAARRNIKLIDREMLLNLAQKFSKKTPDLMDSEDEDYENMKNMIRMILMIPVQKFLILLLNVHQRILFSIRIKKAL